MNQEVEEEREEGDREEEKQEEEEEEGEERDVEKVEEERGKRETVQNTFEKRYTSKKLFFLAVEAASKFNINALNFNSVLGSHVLVVLFVCVFCDSFLCSILKTFPCRRV